MGRGDGGSYGQARILRSPRIIRNSQGPATCTRSSLQVGVLVPITRKYWLYRWIDEFQVHSHEDVSRRLQEKAAAARFMELISEEAGNFDDLDPLGESDAVLAGRRIDLSGVVQCSHYNCLRKVIDDVFARMWHYFDKVVVEGVSIGYIMQLIQAGATQQWVSRIEQEVQVLLYLRNIGAEPYLIFVHKAVFCADHFTEEAAALGIYPTFNEVDHEKVARKIIRKANFNVVSIENNWWVSVDGAQLQQPFQVYFEGPKRPTKRLITEHLIKLYSFSLVTDVVTSRYLGLPLAETVQGDWLAKKSRAGKVSEPDVALQLNLPVLDGMPLKDFLKLREDERLNFEAFRLALRSAIRSEISSDISGPSSQIARSVVQDTVVPSLVNIERRMRTGRRALLKKTVLNVSVGSATVTVGALTSIPLIIATGVAAIAATLAFAGKAVDDGSAVELSDYYFLWQAQKAAKHI
jgi:hypothetical protein